MLSTAERVFAFAQSAAAARGRDWWDAYTVHIVRDQQTAFDEVAERVLLVERGDGSAPGVNPNVPLDPIPWAGAAAEGARRQIGTIGPRPTQISTSGTARRSTLWQCDDSTGFAIPDHSGHWLFLPYVDRGEQDCATEFEHALDALKPGWPGDEAAIEIARRPDGWRTLGAAVGRARRAAGRTTAKRPDINVTSLSVLVRFAPRSSAATPFLLERADWLPRHRFPSTGWLATGDAKMKQTGRWQRFRDHYDGHLLHVATAVLPHHGSDQNFPTDFVEHLPNASVFVAPAAPYLNWHHPGWQVRLAIRRAARLLYQVGDGRSRPLLERVVAPPAED